jgi:putative transposase
MANYKRAIIPGASYFFTLVTYRRRPILCDDVFREALREATKTVQSRHPFTIDGWVLLPDHLHCIWTLPPDDANFSMRWAVIKRLVSLSCKEHYHRPDWMTASKIKHRESTIWQRRYWEHCITTEADYLNCMNYMMMNPVKHGLVKQVKDWRYSTFHRDVKRGIYPINWGGTVDGFELPISGEPDG